jgi:hypothetical protein
MNLNQETKNQLLNAFKNLLSIDPQKFHEDLIILYVSGIQIIKEKFADKSRELKAAAMYYLRLQYFKYNSNIESPEKLINDFFKIYDNEFELFKSGFELITDEDYLLISFVYRKFMC